jgi:hypothetical protein
MAVLTLKYEVNNEGGDYIQQNSKLIKKVIKGGGQIQKRTDFRTKSKIN